MGQHDELVQKVLSAVGGVHPSAYWPAHTLPPLEQHIHVILEHAKNRRMIQTIKELRTATNCSLKDGKDAVENIILPYLGMKPTIWDKPAAPAAPPKFPVEVLAQEYGWAAECNLATLERLCLVKKTAKSEIKRQRDICLRMLKICLAVKELLTDKKLIRVQELMKQVAATEDAGNYAVEDMFNLYAERLVEGK